MQCVWCGQHNEREILELTGKCKVCGELQIGNTALEDSIDEDQLRTLGSQPIDAAGYRTQVNDEGTSLGSTIAVFLALKSNSSNKRNPIYLGTILLCASLFLFGITYQICSVEEPMYKILGTITGNTHELRSVLIEQHRLLNSLSLSGIALGSVMVAYSLIANIRR